MKFILLASLVAASQAYSTPATHLKILACGRPDAAVEICVADSEVGNHYVLRKNEGEPTYQFVRATLQRNEQSRIHWEWDYTAFVVRSDGDGNHVEDKWTLHIETETGSQVGRAEFRINGETPSSAFSDFSMAWSR